jgi:hypothetical protein
VNKGDFMSNEMMMPPQPGLEKSAAMDFETTVKMAEVLLKSGFFRDIRDVAQGVTKILAGRELGFAPIASLTGIYIQQGRICHAANLIAAAIKRSGKYNYRVIHINENSCGLEFSEGGRVLGQSVFTMANAERAGLTKGANAHSYIKYARNMLFARAMSNGARWHCPDVFNGITPYTPEELGAVVDGETGEVIPGTTPEEEEMVDPAGHTIHPSALPEPTEKSPEVSDSPITDKQRRYLFAELRDAGVTHEGFKSWLAFNADVRSTKDITMSQFEVILDSIRQGDVQEWVENEKASMEFDAEREAIAKD